ncbi:Amidase enhancer precursor [Pelotomaculum schinkii]|uniref:Amidase enhancer n=1 Tax=Pelotomaculum schinkii TaxID=78350 RepID=A0A4Y7RHY7_9FIRM|nr:SpoIID/LytB domain-containing protein [Pelotomaculum schinkii]TEB08426.1 Amidase enhancer precursor [Pelotomaculum schinkii]
MFRHIMLRTVVLLLVGCLLAAGCTRKQAPAPKPAQPLEDEPTISLFINKTGEKKNLKMEEYIQGVVAAEMDTKSPVNALAAQAILARTFTLENINSGRVKQLRGTDASTSVEEFQAYDPSKINDNVKKAVEQTRGEVITVNNNPVHAWFSACCGGISASAEEGLAYTKDPTPYIKAGAQDGCLAITKPRNKAWEARIPVEQVRAAVQRTTGKDPGAITSVSIEKKGPSGRAEQIKVGAVSVGGPELRLALGSEKVRSMLLTDLRVEGGQLVLKGKGFGHGVGMCQWGARLMAEQGKSPEDIVKFYYQNVDIQKKWK